MKVCKGGAELVGRLVSSVTEDLVTDVVPLDLQAVPAVLRESQYTIVTVRGHDEVVDVNVNTVDVTAALIVPSAGLIDRSTRVQHPQPVDGVVGVKLPPALVERHPHGQTHDIAQQGNRLLKLRLELLTTGGAVEVVLPALGERRCRPDVHPQQEASPPPARPGRRR